MAPMRTLRGLWWGKCGAPLHAAVFAVLVLALPRTALAFSDLPPPPAAAIDSLAQAHPHAPCIVIDAWMCLDLHLDAAHDGLSGTERAGYECQVLQSAGIEAVARILVEESPLQVLKRLDVVITAPDGRQRRLGRGDLTWNSIMDQDTWSRVYTLDGTRSMAVIPGLKAHDRLRVDQQYELRGQHGVPTQSMGGFDAPWLRSWIVFETPTNHEVAAALLGTSLLRDRVQFEERSSGNRRARLWILRAGAQLEPEPWSDGTPLRSVRWTGQVVAVDGKAPSSMVVGRDWGSVGEAYLRRIQTACEPDAAVRALAARLIEGVTDPAARVDSLYAHVQRSYRYLGLFSGLGGIVPETCGTVLANGYGDCKGLGTLLIALLQAAGFEAGAALVRTRHLGPLQVDVPNLAQFNHYIAWVVVRPGADPVWLDATLDGCPAGVVPTGDAAWPVLQLRSGASALRPLPLATWDPGERVLQVRGAIKAQGHLQFELSETTRGSAALDRRQWVLSTARADQSELTKLLLPASLVVQVDGGTLQHVDDWGLPFGLKLAGHTVQPLPGAQGNRFVPRALVRLPERLTVATARQTRVDLRGRADHLETWAIALPTGVGLTPVDSVAVDGPGVRWRRSVWQEGDTLRLRREVRWSQDILPADSAAALAKALDTALRDEAGYFTVAPAARARSQ